MTKEELITKCKTLLVIAKKAKAAKDGKWKFTTKLYFKQAMIFITHTFLEANGELQRLKEEIDSHEHDKNSINVLQEIVDSLTQNKLHDAIKLEEVTKKLSICEKKLEDQQEKLNNFNTISIENESLKRQVQRISEENDSLLVQLDRPEEKSTAVAELQVMTKQYEEKVQEMKALSDLLNQNSAKIKSLIQENSDLKSQIDLQIDETPIDQVKLKYDKVVKKLKLYREKIHEISEKLEVLKSDRKILLITTKDYSDSVSKWQKDISNVSTRMIQNLRESRNQVADREAQIESLVKEIEALKSSKIQSENETIINVKDNLIDELNKKVEHLEEIIKSKEKDIENEKEAQKKLKQAVKKPTVMDLEMEAYEKTLDELNKKLESRKTHVIELEGTIQLQSETIETLKKQIASLESSLDSEKIHSSEIKRNLDSQQSMLRKTEHERTETNLQLDLLTKNHEALKLENNEVKLEMAKALGDFEKRYQSLELERDDLLNKITFLESEVDKFKKLSSSHEKEIENLRTEFASYKIRAQSVLRQNQSKDLSREQELQDENLNLQKTLDSVKDANRKLVNDIDSFKRNIADLTEDKSKLQERCKELLTNLERQSEEVLEESKKRNQEHEAAIKTYQLQIDTLNAFFKKKIEENETTTSSLVTDLKAKILKLEKSSMAAPCATSTPSVFEHHQNVFQPISTSEEHKINLMMMDREEAEGSEDQSSQSSTFQNQPRRKISKGRELMPLDELLNSSFDDNNSNEINEETVSNYSSPSEILEHTKQKLLREENRVSHLTTLLADAEKDLARIQQLNEMLKEEVRRQQRNVDREEHVKNSEYLKNIVIKFCTLNNNDEKQRLIPVLNTILKLSSEENNLLQNSCKSGWGGLWSK